MSYAVDLVAAQTLRVRPAGTFPCSASMPFDLKKLMYFS